MGGEGSMAAANASLKLNRSQLAKRKEKRGFEGSYAHVEMKDFPKATPEQLEILKRKIQLENKRNRIKQILWFIISIFLSLILLLMVLHKKSR
jgi:hypothetical protein